MDQLVPTTARGNTSHFGSQSGDRPSPSSSSKCQLPPHVSDRSVSASPSTSSKQVKTGNTSSATAIFGMKTSLDTFNNTFRDAMANPPPITISIVGGSLPLSPPLNLPQPLALPPPQPLASSSSSSSPVRIQEVRSSDSLQPLSTVVMATINGCRMNRLSRWSTT